MDEKISLYDEVLLNSGGPIMLVTLIDGEKIVCVWRDNKNELKSSDFYISMVEKVPNINYLMS